jgi:hypothetical protein
LHVTDHAAASRTISWELSPGGQSEIENLNPLVELIVERKMDVIADRSIKKTIPICEWPSHILEIYESILMNKDQNAACEGLTGQTVRRDAKAWNSFLG